MPAIKITLNNEDAAVIELLREEQRAREGAAPALSTFARQILFRGMVLKVSGKLNPTKEDVGRYLQKSATITRHSRKKPRKSVKISRSQTA